MAYVEVKLKKAVVVADHLYKPGVRHIVDEATLEAMGDAVASTSPPPAPLTTTAIAAAAQTATVAKAPAKAPTATAAGHKPVVETKSTAKKK
jgi:hypothetical protein